MSDFATIKLDVRRNLNDLGVTSYSVADINDSFADGYDDIVSLTQCIIRKTTLSWEAYLSYYDFKRLVGDYLACVAIFNNVNNRWLDDCYTLKDFDNVRDDWELWTGTPQNWAASSFRYVAVCPKYTSAAGTFDLYYWAIAPTIIDTDTPQIATDFQYLLEKYSTADLLEQFEEINTSQMWWNLYIEHLEKYKERTKNLVKTDLLFRI